MGPFVQCATPCHVCDTRDSHNGKVRLPIERKSAAQAFGTTGSGMAFLDATFSHKQLFDTADLIGAIMFQHALQVSHCEAHLKPALCSNGGGGVGTFCFGPTSTVLFHSGTRELWLLCHQSTVLYL
jgi:hypothetical protein